VTRRKDELLVVSVGPTGRWSGGTRPTRAAEQVEFPAVRSAESALSPDRRTLRRRLRRIGPQGRARRPLLDADTLEAGRANSSAAAQVNAIA